MSRELTLVERYHILKNRNLKEWLTIHYKEPKTHEYMDKHNIPKQRWVKINKMRILKKTFGLIFYLISLPFILVGTIGGIFFVIGDLLDENN